MIDTDERVQADTIPLGIGQQLSEPRTAASRMKMGCNHDGKLRVIEPGDWYCTLSFQSPETRARELIRLCEECYSGQSRKRTEQRQQRPAHTTETVIPGAQPLRRTGGRA